MPFGVGRGPRHRHCSARDSKPLQRSGMQVHHMTLSQLRKLHADCSTLAGMLSWRTPRREYRDVIRFAFLICTRQGIDINDKTIGEWRREFDALWSVS